MVKKISKQCRENISLKIHNRKQTCDEYGQYGKDFLTDHYDH